MTFQDAHLIVLLQTFRMKIILITALSRAFINRLITARFTEQKETAKNTNYNKLTMLMPIPHVILFIKVDGHGIIKMEPFRSVNIRIKLADREDRSKSTNSHNHQIVL